MDREALEKARRLWGKHARIERHTCELTERWENVAIGPRRKMCFDHLGRCPGGLQVVKIGVMVGCALFHIKGTGQTWEEAFDRAATAL